MKEPGFAFERFRSRDSDEWMMRIGDMKAPPILFVPPLFEEMNRTRALIAAIMRRLAGAGFGCWLPDLSGTGESERSIGDVRWSDWRADVAGAASCVRSQSGSRPLVASLRGGALIDDGADAAGWWRLSPVEGASLERDLVRSGIAGVEYAGYSPSAELKAELSAARLAEVTPLRRVGLRSHSGAFDGQLEGPVLWRRSEPASSPELAAAAAEDIERWNRACDRF